MTKVISDFFIIFLNTDDYRKKSCTSIAIFKCMHTIRLN